MPNPNLPNLGTSLANTGFSKPEPGFFESGGGFGGLSGGIRNVTRNLAAGFAKDPAYRQMAAQQLAQEQQMQQQQIAQVRQAVLSASLDSLGQLAESMKGVGSDKITGSPSTMQMIERSANNAVKAMIAAGWPEDDAVQQGEQYKWIVFQSADIQQPNELEQKLTTLREQFPGISDDELKKAAGAYVEQAKGEAPIFQDIIGEGGVKIPGVSYDGGKSFKAMTAENMFGGGQFKGGFEDAVQFVLGQEGGYVEDDANKGPTNMGINSQANPDVDVQNLTTDQAVQVYKERYWDALNLDSLPPSSQIVAFDAAVNQGQDFAAALIRGAGSDPQKMIELRRQAYEKLAQSPEYSQYLPTWNKRLDDLSDIVSGGVDVSKYAEPGKEQARLLTPEEVAKEGLPSDRRWQRKTDGSVEQVSGTEGKNAARMLSKQEASALDLPTDRRWQANPDGTVSQISGTEVAKPDVRLLSTEEARMMGLPTDRRWQEKPDKTVEQIVGTEPTKKEPTETKQIYDPNSPTGIRIVTEEEAIGQPGVPPAQAAAMENKADKEWEDRQTAVKVFEAQAERIKKKLAKGTAVGGVSSLVQTIAGIGAQVEMLGEALGVDASIADPEQYIGEMPPEAADMSAALQSDIVGLAYSMALAQNGNRVTNEDVKRALQQIGDSGMLSDPSQIAAALDSSVESMYVGLEAEAEARGRELKIKRRNATKEEGSASEWPEGFVPLQ